MKLDRTMRDVMLSKVSEALLNGSSKLIKFYDASDVLLCNLEYIDLITDNSGDRRALKFKSPDLTYSLRSTAVASGRVSYFTIDGTPDGKPHLNIMIRGSVGGVGSTADIKFNRLDWSSNTTITLTDLSLIMLQGS
jgi:hypothetical protein